MLSKSCRWRGSRGRRPCVASAVPRGNRTAEPLKKPAARTTSKRRRRRPRGTSTGDHALQRSSCRISRHARPASCRQELHGRTAAMQNAGGARAFESIYGELPQQVHGELTANAQSLAAGGRSQALQCDSLVTEMSNSMAQRAPVGPGSSARSACARWKGARHQGNVASPRDGRPTTWAPR